MSRPPFLTRMAAEAFIREQERREPVDPSFMHSRRAPAPGHQELLAWLAEAAARSQGSAALPEAPAPSGFGATLEPAAMTHEEPTAMTTPSSQRTVLMDIDTQADFCDPTGALFVPGADSASVRAAMKLLVDRALVGGYLRIATADDHQPSDPEISDTPDFQATFPAHCMRGTDGAVRIPETRLFSPLVLGDGTYDDDRFTELVSRHEEALVLKQHFNAFTNPHLDRLLDLLEPQRVIVFGVATDICVNAAVEGLVRRRSHLGEDTDIVVVDDACAGLDPERVTSCQALWGRSRVRRVGLEEALALMPLDEPKGI